MSLKGWKTCSNLEWISPQQESLPGQAQVNENEQESKTVKQSLKYWREGIKGVGEDKT